MDENHRPSTVGSFGKSIKKLDEIISFLKSGEQGNLQTTNENKQTSDRVETDAQGKQQEQIRIGEEDIQNFQKVVLRVCRIKSAEKHPNADSLFKLQVDAGQEQRQIIAGIYNHYNAKELEGRLVVAILNLKARKIRKEQSQGMLLAASQESKVCVKLLSPPEQCVPGDRVVLTKDSQSQVSAEIKPDAVLDQAIWESVASKLYVHGGKATFGGIVLTTQKGDVAVDLEDGCKIR